MSATVGRLRRVAARVRRRLGARTPAPAATGRRREELVLAHDTAALALSGRIGGGATVEAVLLVPRGWHGDTLEIAQDADGTFAARLDLDRVVTPLAGRTGAYDASLRVRTAKGSVQTWRVGGFDRTHRHAAVTPVPVGDGRLAFWHVTAAGNVSLHVADEVVTHTVVHTHDLHVDADGVRFACDVASHSRPLVAARALWVGRQSDHRRPVPVEVEDLSTAADHGLHRYRVRGHVRPADLPGDRPGDANLDLRLELRLADVAEPLTRGVPLPEGRHRTPRRTIEVPRGDRVDVLVPFLTFRAGNLAFWRETFAPHEHRYLQRLRYLAWAFPLVRPWLGIWLVGETPAKAQDNGLQLFAWIRREHPRRRAYYVIAADSPDRPRVERLGHVVTAHSRRHLLLSLLASRYVGTHHSEYLFASRTPWVVRASRGRRVFLQHGVTAMKNVRASYGRRTMAELPPDVVVANSGLEKQILVQELEYLPSQVAVTGFARYDALLAGDPAPADPATVLVMPTWRDWLLRPEDLEGSEYLERWQGLLRHEGLAALAQERGWTVQVVLHPNMRHLADRWRSPDVVLADPDADVQQLLRDCSVLVTDYSSVGFDAAFLGRPVVFYGFDLVRMRGERAPFVDPATDLPGPLVLTPDEVVGTLRDVADRGCQPTAAERERAAAFLEVGDGRCCERTYAVVRRPWTPRAWLVRRRNARWVREAYLRLAASGGYDRAMGLLYGLARRLPRRRLVVLGSDEGRSYSGSPRALHEALVRRGGTDELAYVVDSTVRLPGAGTRKLRRHSPRWYWTLGRARTWIDDHDADARTPRPRGTTFVQTWHGTPSPAGPAKGGRERSWSTLVTSGPQGTARSREVLGWTGPVVEAGAPRNDVLALADTAGAARAAATRRRLGLAGRRRVVLHLPSSARGPLAIDLLGLHARLGDDMVVLVRRPLPRQVLADLGDFVRDVSDYPDVQDLLLVADVLVSDDLSAMADFAVLDRPVLPLAGAGAGEDAELVPGPLLRTAGDVTEALVRVDELAAAQAGQRKALRDLLAPLDDGHASERVLDALGLGASR